MDWTKTKTNLEKLGYTVSVFDTGKEAAAYLNAQIDDTSVAFGGSMTLQELGLYESLGTHNKVMWHWRVPEGLTADDVRHAAQSASVYLSSVNGLSEEGEIINIDGTGNRVSATFYGHDKLYLVVGQNKVAADYDAALYRARNIASPRNAQRLGANTPCAKAGDRCYNCKSPGRICRQLAVFWEKPATADIEVVLISEDLGY